MKRRIGKAVALILGLPLLYLAAGVAGSLIPANGDWVEPENGIQIFVRTNGVHTWLIFPKVTKVLDWRSLVNPSHIKDARYGHSDHVAFGFGNKDFYLNTPTWSDLSVQTALAAAFGRGPALMHVEHVHQPKADPYTRPLRVRPQEYDRLIQRVRSSFAYGPDGRLIPLMGRGYGNGDIFYASHGAYNAGRTCNEWTGETLRFAGIKTGRWTPFSQSIMWRMK